MLKREGAIKPAAPSGISSIGPRLRRLRIQRKVGLAEVAAAAGISVGFLSALERSQMSASVGALRRLARYYRTNILDFFRCDGIEYPIGAPSQTQGARSRPRRAYGIARLGQQGDGATSFSHQASRRKR